MAHIRFAQSRACWNDKCLNLELDKVIQWNCSSRQYQFAASRFEVHTSLAKTKVINNIERQNSLQPTTYWFNTTNAIKSKLNWLSALARFQHTFFVHAKEYLSKFPCCLFTSLWLIALYLSACFLFLKNPYFTETRCDAMRGDVLNSNFHESTFFVINFILIAHVTSRK